MHEKHHAWDRHNGKEWPACHTHSHISYFLLGCTFVSALRHHQPLCLRGYIVQKPNIHMRVDAFFSPDAETCSLNNWSDCSLVLWEIHHLLLKADAESTGVFEEEGRGRTEVRSKSCITDTYAAPPQMPERRVEEGVAQTHTWAGGRRMTGHGWKKEGTGDSHRQTLMLRLTQVFVKWTFLHFTSKQNRNTAVQFFKTTHPPQKFLSEDSDETFTRSHVRFTHAHATDGVSVNTPALSYLETFPLNVAAQFLSVWKRFNLTKEAAFHTQRLNNPFTIFLIYLHALTESRRRWAQQRRGGSLEQCCSLAVT